MGPMLGLLGGQWRRDILHSANHGPAGATAGEQADNSRVRLPSSICVLDVLFLFVSVA
jgi:hypothetical protein